MKTWYFERIHSKQQHFAFLCIKTCGSTYKLCIFVNQSFEIICSEAFEISSIPFNHEISIFSTERIDKNKFCLLEFIGIILSLSHFVQKFRRRQTWLIKLQQEIYECEVNSGKINVYVNYKPCKSFHLLALGLV